MYKAGQFINIRLVYVPIIERFWSKLW